MRKKISEYSFADAGIHSYFCSEEGNLTLIIRSYDSRKIEVVFKDVIGVKGYFLSEIMDFFEETEFDSFANESLNVTYHQTSGAPTIPKNHPYHNYIFLDPEDCIVFQIIAESVNVKKYDEIIKGNIMTVDEFLKHKEEKKKQER